MKITVRFLLIWLCFGFTNFGQTIPNPTDETISNIIKKSISKPLNNKETKFYPTLINFDDTYKLKFIYDDKLNTKTVETNIFINNNWEHIGSMEYYYNDNGDTTLIQGWSFRDSTTKLYYEKIFKYNSANLRIFDSLHIFGTGENIIRNSYTYDENNRLISQLNEETYYSPALKKRYQHDYSYFNNTNEIKQKVSTYFEPITSWCYEYNYNESGELLNWTYKSFDGNEWLIVIRQLFEYNDCRKLIITTTQAYEDLNWKDQSRNNYYYSNNMVDSVVNYKFTDDSLWTKVKKEANIYDLDYKLIYNLVELYIVDVLIQSNKQEYFYDDHHNMIQEIHSAYYYGQDQWFNLKRKDYSYDEFNNTISAQCFSIYQNAWSPDYDSVNIFYNNKNNVLQYQAVHCTVEYGTFSDIHENILSPFLFSLSQNYPNPFNPSTSINFTLPKGGFTSLKIYDILGKEVATLCNEELNAGNYTRSWDAANYSSGVYFYKLSAGNYSETKKMMMIK